MSEPSVRGDRHFHQIVAGMLLQSPRLSHVPRDRQSDMLAVVGYSYAEMIRRLLDGHPAAAPSDGAAARAIDQALLRYRKAFDATGGAPLNDLDAESLALVRQTTLPAGSIPASAGERVGVAAWHALAIASGTADVEVLRECDRLFDAIAACQQPGGALFVSGVSDSPETHWYHELILLHALTTFAVRRRNPKLLAASARAADFHLNETQPDHATSQPWALNAFTLHQPANPLADSQLNAVQTYQSSRFDRTTLLLLADSLYCIETAAHFRGENSQE